MKRCHWFVAALVLLASGPANARPVRVFAIGHKLRVEDAVTHAAYRDRMAALMDAAFPGRASLVQAGVDDVATHVQPADPAAPADVLVVFPENTGLVNALIGSRGAASRGVTSAPLAIVGLLAPYAGPRAHYDNQFPGQATIRTLILALTDTLYRSFYETFRDLAVQHRVWIAASANLAPARRVDAATEPGLVALLRDPDEPDRAYAYEAVTPTPYNTTFLFSPTGDILVPDGAGNTVRAPAETAGVLRGATNKAYLTPIEQPPPAEAAGLALSFGSVRDLDVLDTPIGRLGIVISKDAWMVDVNDRFATKGANLILQPEAFSSWAYDTTEWAPDVFKAGGFANLQKYSTFTANVAACLTGNLADITFDGQNTIIGRERKQPAAGPLASDNAWVGQNAATGFLAVGPWILPDPGISQPALSITDRRAALAVVGAQLLPGSGVACADSLAVGSCENGYRENIVWTDLQLPDDATTAIPDPVRAAPPTFEASVQVSGPESTPTAQHAPKVAARGRRVYVVWHEAAAGAFENVWLAISRDAGAHFGPPIRISDHPAGSTVELHPNVAVRGSRVAVVWQEFAVGRNDDRGRIQLALFDTDGRKRGADVRVDGDATSGKWLPAVAFAGSKPLVTWIDERDRGPEGEVLEHVYLARGTRGGRRFDPAVRLDVGSPVPLATHLDNRWSPAIASSGPNVFVAWADFRNYNWDIFSVGSRDSGRQFAANVRIDDFPNFERINDHPAVALDGSTVHAVWSDLRAREPDSNIYYTRGGIEGPFPAGRAIDDSRRDFDANRDTPSSQWRPSLTVDGKHLFVAWQDHRLGNADIYFTHSQDGGQTFATNERVDDTGMGNSTQTQPSLATGGKGSRRRCFVAWVDDRDGTSDIRMASRPCSGR